MSLEYPCVYYEDEKCKKFPGEADNWCVLGPCSHETPSNADRIRAMSDEALSEFLCDAFHKGVCALCAPDEFDCYGACGDCMIQWLRKPVKGEST